MELDRIYLRYYPPGIGLSFSDGSQDRVKLIDCLDLDTSTNIEEYARKLFLAETRLDPAVYRPEILSSLKKLQKKLRVPVKNKFYHFKSLKANILPLTNVSFNRDGSNCVAGSYDRTARIWDVDTGKELFVLQGHQNAVFSVHYNYPACDKVLTGSFDKTTKLWSTINGLCLRTFQGHTAEVVASEFNQSSTLMVSGSMDSTAKIYDIETGMEYSSFNHDGEVIAAHFHKNENIILTGSFDANAYLWDLRTKDVAMRLTGHTAELSNCLWNFDHKLIATSSIDFTARLWDIRGARSCYVIDGHSDEVLDICFNFTGKLLATCSNDCTCKIWNTETDFQLISTMLGHSDEISRVRFNPVGNLVLTASADKTSRIWYTETGLCSQVLSHTDEVISCEFSYPGYGFQSFYMEMLQCIAEEFLSNTPIASILFYLVIHRNAILTASKDNVCKIWR